MDKSSSNDDDIDRPSAAHARSDEDSPKEESSPQTLVPGVAAAPANVTHEDRAGDEEADSSFASEVPATTATCSSTTAPDERENVANNKVKIAGAAPPASVPGAVSVSPTQSDSKTAEATDASFASELPATTTVASRTTPDETERKAKFARYQFPANNVLDGREFADEEEKTQEVESDRYDEDVLAPSPLVRHPGGRVRYSEDSSGNTKNQRNFELVERIAGPNLPPSEEGDEPPGDETSVHSRSVESLQDVVLAAEVVPAKAQDRGVEAQNVARIHYDKKPHSYRFRWRGLPGVIVLVIIVAVVVVTAVLIAIGKKSDSAALTAEDASPTVAPTLSPEKLIFLENVLIPMSGDAVNEAGTPQNKAFAWLAQRDGSATDADAKLVELYALAVLYFATNGPSWDFGLPFLSSSYACEWNLFGRGAFCNDAITVDEIRLPSTELHGTLPDEIYALTALRVIDMYGNDLIGMIPPSFGNLTMLKTLHLSYNSLNGTIPPSFGNLTMLETLHLSSNSLTGSIPTAIGALPSLKYFDATYNFLAGGIPSFASQQLSEIWLYNNRLNGSLEGFFNSTGMDELRSIRFSNMELSGSLPKSIGNFPQLHEIWLHNNNLTGSIPTEIGLLTNIDLLILADNDMSGTVPIELGNCSRLEELYLRRCGLGGSFPSSVAHLSSLEYLRIEGNNFTNDYNETFCTREDPIVSLDASCLEDKVSCPCCTYCCNATGEEESCVWCGEDPDPLCFGD